MRILPAFPGLVVVLCIAVVPARADRIDDYVKSQMEQQRINGLSLAVVADGKVVKSGGYGFANVELQTPATAETVFKIGSISKQFIATGIMLLVQDGRLKLDDRLVTFFPDAPDTWKPITIRHLLSHTSGLVRESPGFDPLKTAADGAMVRAAYRAPLHFAPGEKWEYCNVGYFALADITHQISHQTWADFLAERVFRPLGMTSTRTTTMTALVTNRANGYAWKGNELQNASVYLAVRPSGAFLSTVLDLAKWDAALDGDRILQPAIRAQMWQPIIETTSKRKGGAPFFYGFGWFVTSGSADREVQHGGSLPGFRSSAVKFLDAKLTVIVLTNWDNAQPEPIARGVAALYLANQRSTVRGSN